MPVRLTARIATAALALWLCPRAAPAEDSRAPVPDDGELASAVRTIRELFEDEYDRRAPADRIKLAKTLLSSAEKEDGGSASRYALLSEAIELAIEAGEVNTALTATANLVEEFRVPALERREKVLSELVGKVDDRPSSRMLAGRCGKLALEAFAHDAYTVASRAADLLASVARKQKDSWRVSLATEYRKYFREARSEFEKLEADRKVLGVDPESPQANRSVGRFLCFYKGEWERGLKHLAKGPDGELRTIAERALASPEGKEALEVADLQWNLAGDEKRTPAQRLRARAGHWYGRAFEGLQGLDRKLAERRVLEAREGLDPFLPKLGVYHWLWFDGENDHVRIDSYRYSGRESLTVEAIAEAHGTRGGRSVVSNTQGSGFGIALERGHWGFWFRTRGRWTVLRSDSPVVPFQRVHLAAVYDGEDTIRFFVDGKMQRAIGKLRGGRHTASKYPLVIGANPQPENSVSWPFHGFVDQIRISHSMRYRRSFKPPDVMEADSDSVLFLALDEGERELVRDLSGHGHDGQVVEAKWSELR